MARSTCWPCSEVRPCRIASKRGSMQHVPTCSILVGSLSLSTPHRLGSSSFPAAFPRETLSAGRSATSCPRPVAGVPLWPSQPTRMPSPRPREPHATFRHPLPEACPDPPDPRATPSTRPSSPLRTCRAPLSEAPPPRSRPWLPPLGEARLKGSVGFAPPPRGPR